MWSYRRGSGGDLLGHQETRPKSSVGQNESDHWSEENYAQKMRQSSLYHSHMHSRSTLRYSPACSPDPSIIDHHHLPSNLSSGSQRVPPAGAATTDLFPPHKQSPTSTSSNTTNSLRRGGGQESASSSKTDINVESRPDVKSYPRHDSRQTSRQDSKPEPRHNHRPDPSLDPRRSYNHEDAVQKLDVSPNTTLNSVPTPPGSYPSSASPSGSVNNSFMRSASARLPRQRLQDDVINTSLPDDTSEGDTRKIQQREESMKRLLEWKQRMLQSPLTRKPNARLDGATTPQPRANSEAYRQQVLSELANQEGRTKVSQSHSHSQNYPASQDTNPGAHTGSMAGQPFEYPDITQGQSPCPNNWPPGIQNANTGAGQHSSGNPGAAYFSPGVPSERPAPQGGSSQTGSDSGSSRKREGRRETSRSRHVSGDARRSTSASRYNSYSSDEDDVKLGDSLPRKLETTTTTSVGPQGSTHAHTHPHAHQNYQHHPHTHQQNYQHHPHPHTQNQYHHYKSDDLQKFTQAYQGQGYTNNGPYNYHGGNAYPQGYPENHANYPNNYKHAQNRSHNYQESQQTHVIADYNNTLSSQHSSSGRGTGTYKSGHYDFQDYHNYKNHQQDYKHHQQDDYKLQQHDYKQLQQHEYKQLQQHEYKQLQQEEYKLQQHEYKQLQQEEYKHQQHEYKQLQQEYKQGDYGTYDKHSRPVDQRLSGRIQSELYQQYSDSEITVAKAHLAQLDGEHREDHLRRLASLNHHMHDLDKQYEMGKPLINLVDNMVKLGSLYRGGDARLPAPQDPNRAKPYYPENDFDTLEFSRRIQERRIVAEDMQLQEHELASADQTDLEGKVMQLYKLDKNLHHESLTIQSLQREKEMLERTLVNLQAKSHGANEGPVELERRNKQRRHLEHELSKLRAHLAVSARKLEETAAENSRLEHEMMMLRQKIQMTMARNCQKENAGSTETRHIESEMVRVQTLLEDLQRRRIELSHQIQKLTSANPGLETRPSPTGVAGAAPIPTRRRSSTWLETDLDGMMTRDRGMDPPEPDRRGHAPVYVNSSGYVEENYMNGEHSTMRAMMMDRDAADNKPDGEEQQQSGNQMDINDADDRMKRYYGILPKEKPLEIKTVRIVKRESTERKKDRTTGGKRVTIGDSLTHLLEDDMESDGYSDVENEPPVPPAIPSFAARTASLPRNYGRNGPGEKASMMAAMMRTSVGNAGTMTRPSNLALRKSTNWKSKNDNPKDRPLSAHEQLFGVSRDPEQTPPSSPSKSDPPSPVFKSAAAKEIIKEMASEAAKHRRAVPKEKRRHFTISSSHPLTLETRDTGAQEGARSRDDCDMECALRPRNHPDVVKSTLSTRDLRFNESTIDNILGAPNKIFIPERYMPDADDEKEPTEEERVHRHQKAESIRKMLSESQTTVSKGEATEEAGPHVAKAKVAAEKKEREHLLALNQILARQVMEKSRVVAAHTTGEPHL